MHSIKNTYGDGAVTVSESSNHTHILLKCWEGINQTTVMLAPRQAEFLIEGLQRQIRKLKGRQQGGTGNG